MTVETEQTRKSLATRIREAAATAGLAVETTMVNGMLRYRIDGETLTPGQTLDKVTAAAIAQQLRKDLGITSPRHKARVNGKVAYIGAWGIIALRCVPASASPWPAEVTTAMYGLDWAHRTGRLNWWVDRHIQKLSDWKLCELIADIAVACTVMGEVPEYLADRFSLLQPECRDAY